MSYRFEIAAGASKKLLVGGKYCEEDIIVTALGGSDAPDVPDEPVTPEYSEGLEYEYDSDYGGAVVMGYGTWDAWSGEDLVIPPTCVIDGVEYNVVYIEYNAMQFGGMKTVRLPETIAVLNSGNFCYSAVTHLYIPFIRTVDSGCFLNESNLQHVQFKDVEYIGDSCFHKCSGTVFDFAACTTVPTLDMEYYDSSYNFGTDPVIVVPENLLEEWKQATNWTLYADYIVVKGQENAQEKTVEITENGSYEVIPDEGKLLRKVTANVAVEQRSKSYDITLAQSSGWVLLTALDEEVLAHINDVGFAVSLVNTSPYEYVYFGGSSYLAGNVVLGAYSEYSIYGIANREQGETNMVGGFIYNPANYTGMDVISYSIGAFRVSDGKYYIKPGNGFIKAGAYHLTFTW